MIMKNLDVVNYLNGLFELSDVLFPVQLTYAIKKNHRKLVAEYGDYDEQRVALLSKYNEDKTDQAFIKELNELLAIEVDIDVHKIPETIFESGEFEITPKQLEILEFMIEIN